MILLLLHVSGVRSSQTPRAAVLWGLKHAATAARVWVELLGYFCPLSQNIIWRNSLCHRH